MKRVGIRELRQQASRYLRDVERGETLEVTDRGRPVAHIVPIGRGDVLTDLEASGRLTRAVGDALALGAPLPAKRGVPLPSAILMRMREGER